MNTLGGEIGLTASTRPPNLAKPTFDVGLKMTQGEHPGRVPGLHHGADAGSGRQVRRGQRDHRSAPERRAGQEHDADLLRAQRAGHAPDLQRRAARLPRDGKDRGRDQAPDPQQPDDGGASRAAFQIKEGRLLLQPFDVKLGGMTMNVAGSNGIDQSLEYKLGLKVPQIADGRRGQPGHRRPGVQGGQAGINLSAAPEIPLGIQLGGTVTNPAVKVDVGSLDVVGDPGREQAVKQAVTQKVDSAAMRRCRRRSSRPRRSGSRPSRSRPA